MSDDPPTSNEEAGNEEAGNDEAAAHDAPAHDDQADAPPGMAQPVVEPPPAAAARPAEKNPESWVETVKTIVYALLIALVIRTFLFQPFNIPTGSMEATLLVGDYLFVEKFAYGYSRHSFPFSFMPFAGRVFARQPTRGDVIVFKMPNPNSDHYMEDYIKRVIGLPGDHIQMLDDRLYINGKIVPRVREGEATVHCPPFNTEMSVPQYRETLPNGVSYLMADCDPHGPSDTTGEFVVPAGHYFMMGDNRDNSDDSRGNVGYVPFEDLVGRAELRFFSIDESAIWYEPWTWPGAIRFSRLFTLID